jgi:hypothetical protein
MTSTRCEVFNWILIPLSIVVGLASLANIQGYYEVYFVYSMALLVTLSHVHYGICTVSTFTHSLSLFFSYFVFIKRLIKFVSILIFIVLQSQVNQLKIHSRLRIKRTKIELNGNYKYFLIYLF